MTLMVILGAGASFDSSIEHPIGYSRSPGDPHDLDRGRPPLANDLFDRRAYAQMIAKHQYCHALFPELRKLPNGSSIELRLEELAVRAEDDEHFARPLLALRRYLADVMEWSKVQWLRQTSGITNYVPLVRKLASWRRGRNEPVYLVTFNYDTLLETACAEIRDLRFQDMGSYIADPHFKVLKPHGSVNWHRRVEGLNRWSIGTINSCRLLDWYWVHGQDTPAGIDWVPAIAIPTVTKSGFEFPDVHREELRVAVTSATNLLVIGWRGMEKHFLSLWRGRTRGKLERIHIVSGSEKDGREVANNLGKAGIEGNDMVMYRKPGSPDSYGFSRFLDGEPCGLDDFLDNQ